MPKKRGIFVQVDSQNDMTTKKIVQRIIEHRYVKMLQVQILHIYCHGINFKTGVYGAEPEKRKERKRLGGIIGLGAMNELNSSLIIAALTPFQWSLDARIHMNCNR